MNPASGGGLLRVVVDTNVYIYAFLHPERPIFQIVQQAAERRYRLLISSAIVNAEHLRDQLHRAGDGTLVVA